MDHVTIHIKPITSLPFIKVTIDNLKFLYVKADAFIMTTNATRSTVDITITKIDVLLDTLGVTVEVPPEYGANLDSLACVYSTTPNISNWNLSLAVNPNKPDKEECNLNVETIKSSIKITEYHTDFQWEYPSKFCESVFLIADIALGNELEAVIKDLVIGEVTKFIDKQLQKEINNLLDRFSEFDGSGINDNIALFHICFSDVLVGEDFINIGAVCTVYIFASSFFVHLPSRTMCVGHLR